MRQQRRSLGVSSVACDSCHRALTRRGDGISNRFPVAVALAFSLALCLPNAWAADAPPTPVDIEQLVAHLERYPPKSYDIEVIAEFTLPKHSEKMIREFVGDVYSRTGRASATDANTRTNPNLENEVQRLLAEQERPRRIRKRCISSLEHGYRLEQAIERNGPADAPHQTGPAETARITEIRINVGNGAEDTRSVTLHPVQSLAGLHPSGHRILEEDVWAGGTVGPVLSLLLRTTLAIGSPEAAGNIERLAAGRLETLRLEVDHERQLPDGSLGRRFTIRVRHPSGKQADAAFDVPADTFEPVWLVTVGRNRLLEVIKAENGIATEWIDHARQGAPDGIVRYTTISRSIDEPVDPALFEFRAPQGWDWIDYTFDPPRIVDPDGHVEMAKERSTRAPTVPPRRSTAASKWFLIGNAVVVGALLLRTLLARYRRVRNKS